MKNCGKCKNCFGCAAQEILAVDFYAPLRGDFCAGNGFGIAIDIGTTTLAFELFNLQTGERLAAFACANSQREFGADVLSRICYANEGGLPRLHKMILSDLQIGIFDVLAKSCATPENTGRVVICGNTAMLHFLQNFSCETLGVFPFAPVSVSLSRKKILGLDGVILPCVSAFIGADIVAGLLYCAESPCLFIDLGTNGEIVLFDGKKFFATSVAAGPTFEGGNISCGVASIAGAIEKVRFEPKTGEFVCNTIGNKPPVGICGTGVISVCAELIRHGIADKTGLMSVEKIRIAEGIFFTQKDMREVQLAKSSIRAGVEILLEESGISRENIGKVFLAGGFGYTMDATDGVVLGILPATFEGKIRAVGNAALGGAASVLLNPEQETKIQKIAANVTEINLATHPKFEELFIAFCDF